MANVTRWNRRADLEPMSRDPFFRRFFDLVEDVTGESTGAWYPAMDLVETAEQFLAYVDLPGIDPKSVEISLQGQMLTLSGHRNPPSLETEGKALRREHVYGEFQRTVQLPLRVDVDKVSASAQNGVMVITMPKAQEHIGRQIPIQVK